MTEQNNANQTNDMNTQKLYRSRANRMIGGVCGGISEHFDIDPLIVRIIAVVSIFFGGLGIIVYIAGLILIPENKFQSPQESTHFRMHRNNTLIWGIILIVVGLFFFFDNYRFFDFHWFFFWPRFLDWDLIWPSIIILAGVLYIFHVLRKDEIEPKSRPDSAAASAADKIGEIFNGKDIPLRRIISEKMVAGVCAGIARYLNIDVAFIRIGWIVLTIATIWVGIVGYAVLAIVLKPDTEIPDGPVYTARPTTRPSEPPETAESEEVK